MDPFDPLFTDDFIPSNNSNDTISTTTTTTATTTTPTSTEQDLLDIFGGGELTTSSSPQQSSDWSKGAGVSAADLFDCSKEDFLCDLPGDSVDPVAARDCTNNSGNVEASLDVFDSLCENKRDTSDARASEVRDTVGVNGKVSGGVTLTSADLVQTSADVTPKPATPNLDALADVFDLDSIPFADEDDDDEDPDLLPAAAQTISQASDHSKVPRIIVRGDSLGGISTKPSVSDGSPNNSTGHSQPLGSHPSPAPLQNEPLLSQGDTTALKGERTDIRSGEVIDDLQAIMDAQGETHGGLESSSLADDILNDFFGTSSSAPVTNGVADDSSDSTLRLEEFVGISDLDDSRLSFQKENSPEIVVCPDSVENVTLKDATTEKALLRNGEDEDGNSLRVQTDSLGTGTDEDKRKSSSDVDMDFAVLELDSSHLNLDMNKQKTSLRKRGSLARRKKPSRSSVVNIVPGSEESIFQDSTDTKPLASPASDAAEDEVFDKQQEDSEPPSEPEPQSNGAAVRKSALPFKPPMVMPGLQDLSKSKLFNQERNKSDDSPTSSIKSPVSATSPLSPTKRSPPPLVSPKPTTKGQKDSQNKTIAAENSLQDVAFRSSSTSSGDVVTAHVAEEVVIPGLDLSSIGSPVDGPKPARTDSGSGSLSGLGSKPGRTDSWSSVSSPRKLSRGDSVSSVDGGDGGARRSSIQGSAYVPIGFRPRRSSSIVLDTNNKLVDSPAPPSPSHSPSTPSLEEEGSQSTLSSGLKSPLYKPPVWLSEMKAKTGTTPVELSARLRTTSSGSTEGSAASFSPTRSRNGSESAGSVDGSAAEGARGRSITDELNQKRREEQEPEKPTWMKAAMEKTSRMADKLQTNKEDQENGGEEEDDKQPTPPWVAELKKKNRPFAASSGVVGGESQKAAVPPIKNGSTNDKENTPVAKSGRDQYTPSWMKSGRQLKKTPVPPPSTPGRAATSNGKEPNRMKAYETPKWKLDLAEKKKRREAGMMSAAESSSSVSTSSSVTGSGTGSVSSTSSTSSTSDVPQWRQQLSQRKKRPTSGVAKDGESETGSSGGGPEWARQAEERRQRLMKSGLFTTDQAAETGTSS